MPSAVSLRYARALVEVVAPPGGPGAADPQALSSQLREFAELVRQNQELTILFATPAIPLPKKRAVLAELASRLGLGPVAQNFLGVVLAHDRFPLLRDIVNAFDQLLQERLGIVEAQVTSARALGEAEKEALEQALRQRTGKQVRLHFSLDPALIGGVTAQVGSTIYDGSVRGQLERLRADLAGRSAAF
ncbi:MAG TPA: ATP synthase F1 subunit delta [Terriglobia bacterium]|nr:ATP synthase F1 subunit delta [Terriglobia bacterium]